jgi:hypothetical protein
MPLLSSSINRRLPQPVLANCDYAMYKSETKFADGVLHYKRTFEIKDVMVPKEKLPARSS